MGGVVLVTRLSEGHPLCELDGYDLLFPLEGRTGFIKSTVWCLVFVAVDALLDIRRASIRRVVGVGTGSTRWAVAAMVTRVTEPKNSAWGLGYKDGF